MGGEIDVFISYKREDRALADQLGEALEAEGYSHVTDLNLKPGDQFGDAIDRMIRNARLVVVLWTPASAASDWVKNEARLGLKLEKYLGVMVEATELPVDLEFKHYEDLADVDFPDALRLIIDAVRSAIGPSTITPQSAAIRSADLNDDLRLFETAERLKSIAAYDAYLASFPNGVMVDIARNRLASLNTLSYRIRRSLPGAAAVAALAAVLTVSLQIFFSDEADKWFERRENIALVQERVAELERTSLQLLVERDQLTLAVSRAESELSKALDRLAEGTSAEISRLTQELSSLRSSYDDKSEELTRARARMTKLEVDLRQSVVELADAQTKFSEAQADIDTKRAEIDRLSLRIEGLVSDSPTYVLVPKFLGADSANQLGSGVVCLIDNSTQKRDIELFAERQGIALVFLNLTSGPEAIDKMMTEYMAGNCEIAPVARGMVDSLLQMTGNPDAHLALSLD